MGGFSKGWQVRHRGGPIDDDGIGRPVCLVQLIAAGSPGVASAAQQIQRPAWKPAWG